MERLRGKDLSALLDFLRDAYALRDHPAFVSHILSALSSVVPSEITTYNEMDPLRATSRDWINPSDLNTPARRQIWEQVMRQHPVLDHCLRSGDGRALKISDFLSSRQFHRLELYNEHFRAVGVTSMMGVALPSQRPLVIGIALHRSRGDFAEQDRLLLDLLRPHLVQAYANARAVTRLHQELAALREAVETMGGGMIVLSLEGQVQQATPQARRWLAAYFGRCPPSRLPEPLWRWVRHQEGFLVHEDDAPAPREPLMVERDGKRLIIRLLSEPTKLLLLLEEQSTALDPTTLEAFGLSRRETEVLYWVAQGKTNPEIALILGLSPRTVGKHLERIFPKLGVETRTAAAARALEHLQLSRRADR